MSTKTDVKISTALQVAIVRLKTAGDLYRLVKPDEFFEVEWPFRGESCCIVVYHAMAPAYILSDGKVRLLESHRFSFKTERKSAFDLLYMLAMRLSPDSWMASGFTT